MRHQHAPKIFIFAGIAVLLGLSGCGTKGPLQINPSTTTTTVITGPTSKTPDDYSTMSFAGLGRILVGSNISTITSQSKLVVGPTPASFGGTPTCSLKDVTLNGTYIANVIADGDSITSVLVNLERVNDRVVKTDRGIGASSTQDDIRAAYPGAMTVDNGTSEITTATGPNGATLAFQGSYSDVSAMEAGGTPKYHYC